MRMVAAAALLMAFTTMAEAQDAGALRLPVALFVKERATGYGMYEARANNHYKPGEQLLFYIEPTDYKYQSVDNLNKFGATMDLRLTQNGKILYSKDSFLKADFLSHHMNKEINFSGSLDVTGAPAGEYNLELIVQDAFSNGVAKAVLPFIID